MQSQGSALASILTFLVSNYMRAIVCILMSSKNTVVIK